MVPWMGINVPKSVFENIGPDLPVKAVYQFHVSKEIVFPRVLRAFVISSYAHVPHVNDKGVLIFHLSTPPPPFDVL